MSSRPDRANTVRKGRGVGTENEGEEKRHTEENTEADSRFGSRVILSGSRSGLKERQLKKARSLVRAHRKVSTAHLRLCDICGFPAASGGLLQPPLILSLGGGAKQCPLHEPENKR